MDIVCFSHLRWNFVFQRPQHILTRLAKAYRVFYVEEPVFNATYSHNEMQMTSENVMVVTPHIGQGVEEHEIGCTQHVLLDELFGSFQIREFIL